MSSRGPPLKPDKSASGIALDPRTLDRVIPETRRADGSLRKERKVRPGFTPQEDVQRFRGTRQLAAEARTGAGKGPVPGYSVPGAAPSSASTAIPAQPLSKSAKKNEKRKKKRQEKADEGDTSTPEPVAENWDSDEDVDKGVKVGEDGKKGGHTSDEPKDKGAHATDTDDVAEKLDKLAVS